LVTQVRVVAGLLTVALAFALVSAGCVPSAPGGRDGVDPRPAPESVGQWARFEAALRVEPAPANPFDPDVIDVRATFVDPHGVAHVAYGFWYQGYRRELVDGREQLTPKGKPGFRVRFTPDEPGRWTWSWSVRRSGGTVTTPVQTLTVTPQAGNGFLRRSRHDARYLAFDDGSPYFAVGENVGWYDQRGTYAYDAWFRSLKRERANFARLWMPSWAFGIEWSDTGLGDYTDRLDRAWQLDRVLRTAEARGIYVELSLLNHGAFSTVFNSEWAANPYNAANGGPLATPAAFFTDATARKFFEQRLRYIVARYGWSTHLLAWELWNEVDLTDGYNAAAVTAWHEAVTAVLRDLDPYDHLVTTSHALFNNNDSASWPGGGLDFTQLHHYSHGGFTWFTNLAQDVVQWSRDRVAATGRPVLFAELGANSLGPNETRATDPDGLAVHDGLFAGAVSGGLGTAMTWWWDNLIDVEPDRYYPMFGSVARFVRDVVWDRESFTTLGATATSSATARPLVVYGLRGTSTALVWLKDDGYQTDTPTRPLIGDARLDVHSLSTASWCGRWYDTWAGTWGARVVIDAGATSIAVPPFSGDVALRLGPCAKK
jgi:hypothetical protein